MKLNEAPFYLDQEAINWVETTLENMTDDDMIGQLFCPIGYSTDRDYLDNELLRYGIGGMFFRDGPGSEMRDTFEYAQKKSPIPLLIPSNLESGGDGAATDGTPYGKQMSVAAADDPRFAYRLGRIACSEGASLGINWAFAPVVDLDLNYHNPITNVRTYGSDVDRVIANAGEYIRAAKECNVATAVKHFPGDGIDERDQHLLTSVNTLGTEEWDETYGRIYKEMIEAGTLTVMAGHIALPAYEAYFDSDYKGEIIPATLSGNLLKGLLRDKLGFNGLIISDATPMVGFAASMKREEAVPKCIESGCDMLLFNKDLAEDHEFMKRGYARGILSRERLVEANTRILALKAALSLHKKKAALTLVPDKDSLSVLGCEEHVSWARELADKSVTLVKDKKGILPISAGKTKRVLLEILGDYPSSGRVLEKFKSSLTDKGFEVFVYEKEDFKKGVDNVSSFLDKYDLAIYIGNIENVSNQTTARLNWYTFWGQGNNVPWFAGEVPVIFISMANPYHLLDVPMIDTYINCYSNNDFMIDAVMEKITGGSAFKGISPIDPFCGMKYLEA